MARVRKSQPTLESLFFATPEQRVLRLLISEPTTAFTPRVIFSKLKGIRGLGGTEGLHKILDEFQAMGLIDYVDNHRAVRLRDDNTSIQVLKIFGALCDLEGLRQLVEPISSRGVLFGSRASGRARSDSDYDLFVVSETPDEVKQIAGSHPLGKDVELVVWTPEMYESIESEDPTLKNKLEAGIVLWGSSW
jgi:predicted nucleotidyltransferase